MQTLHTERLLLRGWQETDLDDLYAYAKDPQVGPMAGWPPHANREESAAVLQRFMADARDWAIVERASGRVIGSFGLFPDATRPNNPQAYMIGYVLGSLWWGQGYMSEAVQAVLRFAFREKKLPIVSVCHFVYNRRSRRVIEKAGFRYEGTRRQAFLCYDGVCRDECYYSLTREEYFAAHRRG